MLPVIVLLNIFEFSLFKYFLKSMKNLCFIWASVIGFLTK